MEREESKKWINILNEFLDNSKQKTIRCPVCKRDAMNSIATENSKKIVEITFECKECHTRRSILITGTHQEEIYNKIYQK